MERIDKLMLEEGMVLTRSQARMLIKQGDVFYQGRKVTKPGQLVDKISDVEIKERQLYVSRGAYKIEKAINFFNIDLKDKIIMDCGASTGGFTQVSLEMGAKKVYALDVGHDQLSPILINDERVVNREGLNLKYAFELDELVDGFVMDLSFISIQKVIPNIITHLNKGAFGLILIKPQFEVGKDFVDNKGLVKRDKAHKVAEERRIWLQSLFKEVSEIIESPILGKTGNLEFLVKVTF